MHEYFSHKNLRFSFSSDQFRKRLIIQKYKNQSKGKWVVAVYREKRNRPTKVL